MTDIVSPEGAVQHGNGESLTGTNQSEDYFAIWRMPGGGMSCQMMAGEWTTAYNEQKEQREHQAPSQQVFCLAPFDPSGQVTYMQAEVTTILLPNAAPAAIQANDQSSSQPFSIRDASRWQAHYHWLVAHAVEAIKAGDFSKLVCSHPLDVQLSLQRHEQYQLFTELAQAHPQAFVYWVSHPKWGTWLAATPETLLKSERGTMFTHALAGTKPKSFVEESLAAGKTPWAKKELEEHEHVVDYIKQTIINSGIGVELEAADPVTTFAGPVAHLLTPLTLKPVAGSAKEVNATLFQQVVAALHPTSATCGSPREAALQFLKEHEGYDRALYAGYVGLLNGADAHLFVNLRCLSVAKDHVRIYVGAGITAASDPADEWGETLAKAETVMGPLWLVTKGNVARQDNTVF